jgi:hypothetical protein
MCEQTENRKQVHEMRDETDLFLNNRIDLVLNMVTDTKATKNF